jgi:hypothetical protein
MYFENAKLNGTKSKGAKYNGCKIKVLQYMHFRSTSTQVHLQLEIILRLGKCVSNTGTTGTSLM